MKIDDPKIKNSKSPFEKMCRELSEDMDSDICKDVAVELEKCPDCHFFYNSVEKTIEMYREAEEAEEIDDEMELRLLRVLNLDDFKCCED